VVGRKHRTEGGEHDVVAAVRERKFLDVGFLEAHREPFGLCARTALVEQRGNVIGRRHMRKAARGRQGRVAVTSSHVEDVFIGANVDGLGK
jgi:hypothetical protein